MSVCWIFTRETSNRYLYATYLIYRGNWHLVMIFLRYRLLTPLLYMDIHLGRVHIYEGLLIYPKYFTNHVTWVSRRLKSPAICCLFNGWFRLKTKKMPKLRISGPLWEESIGAPCKGDVIRRVFRAMTSPRDTAYHKVVCWKLWCILVPLHVEWLYH